MTYKLDNNEPLVLGREVGAGGEAIVYTLVDRATQVAKIYHKPDVSRAAKLRAMLANPPGDIVPEAGEGHVSIAWPDQLIFDLERHCVGFMMPYVNAPTNLELSKLYNPQDRRQNAPGFTWKYLLRTARNISAVLNILHQHGHIVGDLNESNWLVSNAALVTLVDCDSMQVTVTSGESQRIYRCPVGKAEYTPPELQGCNFNLVNRNAHHDNFSLAVLIFLLLMEGVHPFQGRWTGAGEPPGVAECIERGLCPYVSQTQIKPPPFGLPFNILPSNLQDLFLRCFGPGFKDPAARPTAAEWQQALSHAEATLTVCATNDQHYYSQQLAQCPWCARVAKGLADSFPPKVQLARLLAEAKLPRTRSRPAQPRPRPTPAGSGTVAATFSVMPSAPPASTPRLRSPAFTLFFTLIGTIVVMTAIIVRVVGTANTAASPGFDNSSNQTMRAEMATVTDPAGYYNTRLAKANAVATVSAGIVIATPTVTVPPTPLAPPTLSVAKILSGHNGPVTTIAFSADSKLLASGSSDDTVKVWEVGIGQELQTFIGYNPVTSVTFDPRGKILVSVSAYNPPRLWNLDTGKEQTTTGSGLHYSDTALFSADGKTLITVDAYDAVFYSVGPLPGSFYQSGSLALETRRLSRPNETIVPLTLSPNGKLLAIENQDHSLTVIDAVSLGVIRSLPGHSDKVLSLAFSSDGSTLASAGADKQIILWNALTGQELHALRGQPGVVSAVAFSPDGTILASGDYAGNLRLWDVGTGKLLETVVTESAKILAVAFSPDGKTLAAAATDKTVKLWRLSR